MCGDAVPGPGSAKHRLQTPFLGREPFLFRFRVFIVVDLEFITAFLYTCVYAHRTAGPYLLFLPMEMCVACVHLGSPPKNPGVFRGHLNPPSPSRQPKYWLVGRRNAKTIAGARCCHTGPQDVFCTRWGLACIHELYTVFLCLPGEARRIQLTIVRMGAAASVFCVSQSQDMPRE